MPPANLSFLPWVRQGAAGAIARRRHARPEHSRPSPTCRSSLNVNADALPAVPLRLRGPADVVGIDRHQVVRTDPRPNTSDFEPNCFPSIEFDRADFPWLFTPARANTNGQLRPWLCLVVVRQQDGVQLTSAPRRAAADAQDRRAGQAVPRAARPEGLLGVGARPGRGRQHGRSERGRRGVERRAAPLALAAGVSAAADAEHRLPRLRRADLRARTQGRPRAGDRRHRADRARTRSRTGVDADRDGADAGPAARLLLVAVPHRRRRRLRSRWRAA